MKSFAGSSARASWAPARLVSTCGGVFRVSLRSQRRQCSNSLLGGPLLWAAMSDQDVVVHGPVSAGGLYNLSQLIEVRQRLSPERYPRVIEVRPGQYPRSRSRRS